MRADAPCDLALNKEGANNFAVNGRSGAKQGGFPAYGRRRGRGEESRVLHYYVVHCVT
jgi:hypothetical protein